MNHAALFNGIGGFQLAADWMGWQNVLSSEIDDWCSRITKYYYPDCEQYKDIKKTDFKKWKGTVDIVSGGFPCQPFSTAGKGDGTEDNRYLWPEMFRAIQEIKPTYVVAENVYGIVSWNGGLVFEKVQSDLEAEGYEVQPVILPASGVGAPHKRDRVWFVAYSTHRTREAHGFFSGREINMGRNEGFEFNSNGPNAGFENLCKREKPSYEFNDVTNAKGEQGKRMQFKQCKVGEQKQGEFRGNDSKVESKWNASNSKCKRQQKQRKFKESLHKKKNKEWKASWSYDDGRWPAQSPICSGNDGLSRELDGITFSKWRRESIKAYGNAIVPQVAFQIFKAIEQVNQLLTK